MTCYLLTLLRWECLIYFLLSFVQLCQADINPLSIPNPYYREKGSNVTIPWSYNNSDTEVGFRQWSFSKTSPPPVQALASIFGNANPIMSKTRPFKNFKVIKPATLIITSSTRSNSGTYRFEMTLSATGEKFTSDVEIIITEKPTAMLSCTRDGTSIILNESETVLCWCNSTGGNPPPIALWSKDGKMIESGNLNTRLLLENVSKSDTGNYDCTARSHTLTDTKFINITVRYQPSIISFKTNQRNGLFVNSGVSITITCKADAYPAARYIISHNGIFLNGVVGGVYTINSVKLSDGGEYTCQASNEIGSASKKLVLIVKEKPKAQATCPSTTVRESSYVTCVCKSISGQPTPTATWIKDGSNDVINGTSNSSQMLVFSSIKRTDNGKYWCKVENSVSFDNVSVNIIVHYKPKFIPIPPILSFATLGSMFNMTFFADGNPPPKLTLSHNGTILMETGASKTLIINSISYNDSGVYECRAQNILGEERRSTYLVVTANTKTDCSGTDKLNNENCKSYWYISVITLFCGILIGAVVTYVTPRIRHRRSRNKESVPPAEYAIPSTSTEEKRNNPVYQELNLQDMNKGENYQALKRNTRTGKNNEAVVENEAGYQELNKVREKGDDNYQSLNRA